MSFLFINKPKDWTSHDIVSYIRNIAKKKTGLPTPSSPSGLHRVNSTRRAKVGHAGTLDPFATGLLVVGVGRESTKQLDKFKNLPKTYIATLKLGSTSDTYDSTGKITLTKNNAPDISSPLVGGSKRGALSRGRWSKAGGGSPGLTEKQIRKILKTFVGEQEQIPPMYSAKKVKGKKLYELARKGVEIEREPSDIEIYGIKLLSFTPTKNQRTISAPPTRGSWRNLRGSVLDNLPSIKIKVVCSTGTYIRSLANDIGEKLGTGAYCDELERTKIGDYSVENAVEPKKISKENFENYILEKTD